MIQMPTGSNTIFRFDDALDGSVCEAITESILKMKEDRKPVFGAQIHPWHDGDTFYWANFQDQQLKKAIAEFRSRAAALVSESFKTVCYPEFTDIVLWRKGRQMGRHKDDGYDVNDPLKARKFSAITYLNDDYRGGETFIRTESGRDYISRPKTGAFVFFLSNETNEHGVNKVKSGNRVTMPLWFCTEEKFSEDKRLSGFR